jgi:hypothetical protein
MESRLEQLGYRLSGSQWKDAIDIDLNKLPGGKAQAKQIRQMVTNMIQAQKKAGKPAPEKAAKEPVGEHEDAR